MNWLLLRGLTRETTHWGNFPEIFQSSFAGAKVHLLDLPGVGSEAGRPAPTNIGAMVEQLRSRWLALGHEASGRGEWAICSISLGSMVALEWIAKYPGDFKRAVVMNTSAANLNKPWQRLSYKMIPRVLAAVRARDAFRKERQILQMTTHMQRDLDERAREWAAIATARPVKVSTALAQIRAALSFRLNRDIRVPVLVLNSLNDQFTDPSCSENIARALGAKLSTHSFAGHDIPLDDPQWVAEMVREFVEKG